MGVITKWEKHGVYRRYCGKFSPREMEISRDGIYSDDRFTSIRYSINDFSESVPDTLITPDFIMEQAVSDSAASLTNPRIIVAAVTDDHEMISLLQHYFRLKISQYPLRIFPTLAEAREWIANHPSMAGLVMEASALSHLP